MSLNLNGTGKGLFGSNVAATVQKGADLEEIQTDALGFLSLSGEAKVQLLPSSWPVGDLPPPTASLLSVASQRGLIAAAGPNAIIVATTESVRKAFEKPKSGDNEIRPFQPQLTLPMQMRISQVTFTADENYLVLSAEIGGGLAIYDVQSLLNGSTQASFEMSTNSSSLRALVSNPTPEKGDLLAVVTTDGDLMIANLKERIFISGANGQILKAGVSCVSWSTKGKQLVAGLGDGTAYQMTPEGQGKSDIPRPPGVDPNHHVSSITWLENNVFLVVHTPSTFDSNSASTFHIVTRQLPSEYIFQKIREPTTPFGLNRLPPHHFLVRLKDFPPHLQDLLIVASSASTDIGLFSRSKAPFVSGKTADRVTGVFTLIEMSDDSRRAQLPMTEDMTDTSPIGMALDLSSKDKVIKPIAGDEIEQSLTPAPALMVLNNDGILASWWVIYTESIRQGTAYPGLVNVTVTQQSTKAASAQPSLPFGGSVTTVSLDQPSFGAKSGLGATTFGATSGLQKAPSPWITQATNSSTSDGSTFGISTIGSTATPIAQGVSFGSSAFPGHRSSPWAAGSTKAPGVAFGQTGGIGMGVPPLGMAIGRTVSTMAVPSSGGFASFANQGGFAAVTPTQANTGSLFGSKQQASGSMASSSTTATSKTDTGSVFGLKSLTEGSIAAGTSSSIGNGYSLTSVDPKNTEKPVSLLGSAAFSLGSTFKPDESAKGDDLGPSNGGGIPSFGRNFEIALGEAQKAAVAPTTELTDADMDTDEPTKLPHLAGGEDLPKKQTAFPSEQVTESTTPMSTPASLKFQFPNPTPPLKGGLFGTPVIGSSTSVSEKSETSRSETLDTNNEGHSGVPNTPKSISVLQSPSTPKVLQIKQEPASEVKSESNIVGIPEPPLPPDPVSKTSYAAGESSVSSTEPDLPLPPDFVSARSVSKTEASRCQLGDIKSTDFVIPIRSPEDDISDSPGDVGLSPKEQDNNSDSQSEEESDEDITKYVSPVSNSHQTSNLDPQSPFDGAHRITDSSSIFTKIPQGSNPSMLFGEIDGTTTLRLQLPTLEKQPSPRSPSPVLTSIPSRLRPEPSRSVSAPYIASQLFGSRRLVVNKPPQATHSTFAISEQDKIGIRQQEEIISRSEAEEFQDKEDDETQELVQHDIVGSKILADFIAHQDYVGNVDKNSIPAQVEILCRDISSMIDTLGINSYTLKSFIKGHTEQYNNSCRTKEDLERDDEWCLIEINSLSRIIEGDLKEELEQGKVKDVDVKLHACANLERDLVKLRAKHDDIKALLTSRSDPDRLVMVQSLPLTAEQATQQHDLRRDFANFRKLLSEVEEDLVLLRAKLASYAGVNGKIVAGPTVEAVMRTINKMTIMVEKRSGDIDVLENQMRKLRCSSTISNASREGSPFTTPTRFSMRNSGISNTHSMFYTPDSVRDSPRGIHASFVSSTYSTGHGTPTRKKIDSFTNDDKLRLKACATHRSQITSKVTVALQKCGTRILYMDEKEGGLEGI